jgi:cysteine desulfurase
MAQIAKSKGVYFHTDAVQAVGKIPMKKTSEGISFMSLSGHKLHCPKGIGALYVNRKARFVPFMNGGSQENYKRAGTQNVASIVGFGKACEIALKTMTQDEDHVRRLRDQFESSLQTRISGIQLNGDPEHRLPNTSNLAFENIDAEMLLQLLDEQNVACSAGSACTAGSINPSHVLKAMGCSDRHARSSLRFSFSRYNTQQEMLTAVELIESSISKIRAILS